MIWIVEHRSLLELQAERFDLIKRKKLKVDKIQWLVLDEADEMLSMGFKDDLRCNSGEFT